MNNFRSTVQEAAEDIFFGQVVINWARWSLIAGGIVLVLWSANNVQQLIIGTIPVFALMAVNFYLHGRQLAEKPANPALMTVASLLDVAVITMVVVIWPEPEYRGLESPFFVMYYPLVMAFAFVMRPVFAAVYTSLVLIAYGGACVLATSYLSTGGSTFDLETLLARLVTLGAMGGLGTYYWRIQRNRRRVAVGEQVTQV